jgi:hypothetical protein
VDAILPEQDEDLMRSSLRTAASLALLVLGVGCNPLEPSAFVGTWDAILVDNSPLHSSSGEDFPRNVTYGGNVLEVRSQTLTLLANGTGSWESDADGALAGSGPIAWATGSNSISITKGAGFVGFGPTTISVDETHLVIQIDASEVRLSRCFRVGCN